MVNPRRWLGAAEGLIELNISRQCPLVSRVCAHPGVDVLHPPGPFFFFGGCAVICRNISIHRYRLVHGVTFGHTCHGKRDADIECP